MISDSPGFFFTLLDREYFEPLDRYQPLDEYIRRAESALGGTWTVRRGGYWTQCVPPLGLSLEHGWKIHVSSQVPLGGETLDRVLPILRDEAVGFKFCSDSRMLTLSLNKNWPRTGAGKFITIYPPDLEAFVRVIGRCAAATSDLDGPYILSDRRYPGSRVVHYRYGEHASSSEIGPAGERSPMLVGPQGQRWSDQRQPWYQTPPWAVDPFPDPPVTTEPDESGVLLRDRYRITGAERFSCIGGIYGGIDTATGRDVIIREARPHLGTDGRSIDILRKEARILKRMATTGYFARYVDLFQEWEHWFLVQERLDAESLWGYAIGFTAGLESGHRTARELLDRIRTTVTKIAEALRVVHARGIVLRDLTKSNVMFTRDTDEVRFIDLELSYELEGDEPPLHGWTAGYASDQQLASQMPTPADDIYALGALILDMITFTASGLTLNRRGIMGGMRRTLEDLHLPMELYDVVAGLTAAEPEDRWTLDEAIRTLASATAPSDVVAVDVREARLPEWGAPPPDLVRRVAQTVGRIADFAEAKADYARDDRLFPGSGVVFNTNPVSVQFGSAGTCYFLWRSRGSVPVEALDWTVRHLGRRPLPPGLMMGSGGVAWVLRDLGAEAEADALLDAASGSRVTFQAPGLYYGAAGYGLANLYAWWRSGADRFAERAASVGEWLLETGIEDDEGLRWEADDRIPLGYGHGGSGVAAFLDHLYAGFGDRRFLDAAGRAFDYEWGEREQLDSRVIWFAHKGARVSSPKSPHVRHGTAGIGAAMLRHWALTREPEFARRAGLCAYTVSSRFTNKLWHDYGLSGYGQLLIDMARFGFGEAYRDAAYHLAEALLTHAMERDEGTAFLGEDMLRISCDFAMGSAGIGLFLHRLSHPATDRFLWIDEMIRARGEARELRPAMSAAGAIV